MKTQKVIFTGGPGTGKTSVINELEKHGYNCVPEASRQILKEEMEKDSDALPWIDILKFSEIAINRIKNQFHDFDIPSKNDFAFFDRGLPDVLAYMRHDDVEIPEQFNKLSKELRYHDIVFLFPYWDTIYETDSQRVEDSKTAKTLESYLKHSYEILGYEVIEIPKVSIEERVNFVKNKLKLIK
ncbi:MAG: ATP-binding protein [Ichthyobacteriaceae bacterium]|nr:ATP-binding protein [Ichthyobacteriaceae bacterium]